MNKDLKIRFWEIDSLRGLAIILMIIYHFLFDLNYFNIYNINLSTDFYWWFTRFAASIFIILVGVSLTLSYSRNRLMNANKEKSLFPKYLRRGLKIFIYGLIITFITWIFIREEFIIFGILHFIGLAIILEYPFIRYKYLNLILGFILAFIGIIVGYFSLNFNLALIGLIPVNLNTVDYFPLLPWLGVVSIGLFLGNTLYRKYKRRFYLPDLSQNIIIQFFSFLGRNSLIIYLLHQPLLIAILYLFGGLDISILFN